MEAINRVIEIPVRSYVKKVLTKWYHQEPFPLHDNNMMGKSLIAILADVPTQTNLISDTIRGEKAEFELSHRLIPFYEKFENAFNLGFYFEKVVQHIMYTHVAAQGRCGIEAKSALYDFFKLYGIEDEDYDIDTAYRLWQFNKSKFN